jgi:type II secretion system protein I
VGPPTGVTSDGGFTLLEVLVALTILGIAVVSLIELSSQSLRLIKSSSEYQQAAVLADRLATGAAPNDETVEQGQEGNFQWERKIALVQVPEELLPKETVPGREPPKLFVVTIDVRWGRDQSLELATLRTPIAPPPSPAGSTPVSGAQSRTPTTQAQQNPPGTPFPTTTPSPMSQQ